MSTAVNTNAVRDFYARWERLEDEKQAVSDGLKALFKEASAEGLNTKAMRAAFRVKRKHDEDAPIMDERAEIDLYLVALGIGDEPSLARDAREEPSDLPPHDPDTGEVEEQEADRLQDAIDSHSGGIAGALSDALGTDVELVPAQEETDPEPQDIEPEPVMAAHVGGDSDQIQDEHDDLEIPAFLRRTG